MSPAAQPLKPVSLVLPTDNSSLKISVTSELEGIEPPLCNMRKGLWHFLRGQIVPSYDLFAVEDMFKPQMSSGGT